MLHLHPFAGMQQLDDTRFVLHEIVIHRIFDQLDDDLCRLALAFFAYSLENRSKITLCQRPLDTIVPSRRRN